MLIVRRWLSRALQKLPRWLRWVLAGGVAVFLLVLVWGVGIEPRLLIEEHEVANIPGLPQEWQGQRIALIADPQVGMFLSNTDTIRRAVARLVELRPAAVFIAGDFIYHPLEDEPEEVREEFERDDFSEEALDELREIVDLLRPLQAAGIPSYAVLGNHDYGLKSVRVSPLPWLAKNVRQELEAIGIRVLQNEAIRLPAPGASSDAGSVDLWLVGFGPHLPDQDYTQAALAQIPDGAARLVLMHNPDTFDQLPAQTAPLAVAGHTHGGQVRLPGLVLHRLAGRVNEQRPDLSGWIHAQEKPGNRLYINRGIGFSRFPIRLNCPPELTVFTLRAPQ